MSFFGEEADGFNMSPKAILLFSVAYMGCVILLHIFGKISTLKTGSAPGTPEGAADAGAAGDLWVRKIDSKSRIIIKSHEIFNYEFVKNIFSK